MSNDRNIISIFSRNIYDIYRENIFYHTQTNRPSFFLFQITLPNIF